MVVNVVEEVNVMYVFTNRNIFLRPFGIRKIKEEVNSDYKNVWKGEVLEGIKKDLRVEAKNARIVKNVGKKRRDPGIDVQVLVSFS